VPTDSEVPLVPVGENVLPVGRSFNSRHDAVKGSVCRAIVTYHNNSVIFALKQRGRNRVLNVLLLVIRKNKKNYPGARVGKSDWAPPPTFKRLPASIPPGVGETAAAQS